ncbi:arabinofuranosidase catalytic domain-containing protein [Sphaerisporangium sp. B11E5]|uniref:arabinofuranosidase catalytic domain-containing protein n=1 Tax=Sphaerisporangium sp. B11E5 TaxID=3153563 RepID=UPI00325DF653
MSRTTGPYPPECSPSPAWWALVPRGQKAYGVYIAPGTGYRNNSTDGVATGDQPEGMYAVLDGTHHNGGRRTPAPPTAPHIT